MKMKSLLLIILFVILCYLIFYNFVTKITIKDLSSFEPFRELVITELYSKRRSILVVNKYSLKKEYSFQVIDAKNIFGQEDSPNINIDGMDVIEEIPIGTPLRILNAELHGGGVAGVDKIVVFGKIKLNSNDYLFSYFWGYQKTIDEDQRAIDKSDRKWSFERAIWQDKAILNQFELPI